MSTAHRLFAERRLHIRKKLQTEEIEHTQCAQQHIDSDIGNAQQEQLLEHLVGLFVGGLPGGSVGGHDDGTAGGQGGDSSGEGGGHDSGDQLDEVDGTGKLGGNICGNGKQGGHDDAGGGADPAEDAGGGSQDGRCGTLGHQAGEEVGDQVDAAQLLDDVDQGTHAADEYQRAPGNALNGLLLIGAAQQNQYRGGNEGEQAGVQLEADATDDHDDDGNDGAQLLLIELGDLGPLQRVVSLDLVALEADVEDQGEDEAG